MPFIDTHRATTEAWECDQNDHLNVQFYHKRFDEAGAMLAALHGAQRPATFGAPPPAPHGALRRRHVRHLAELRGDDASAIASAVLSDGPHAGAIVHIMRHAVSGEIAATCLDLIDAGMAGLCPEWPRIAEAELPVPLTRGLTPEPWPEEDDAARLAAGTAAFSAACVVQPALCAGDGALMPWALVGCFSTGAATAWEHMGLRADWLAANDLGRIAVEVKLSIHHLPRAGACLRQLSWPSAMGDKTLGLRHQIRDAATGRLVAQGEIMGMALDLSARRAAPLPDGARARIADLMARETARGDAARELAGEPAARELAGEPAARELAGEPAARELAGEPAARELARDNGGEST
jgi:acyl-CoA thioester hydrolase